MSIEIGLVPVARPFKALDMSKFGGSKPLFTLHAPCRQISTADQMKAFLAAVIPQDQTPPRPAQTPQQRHQARRQAQRQHEEGPAAAAPSAVQVAAPLPLPFFLSALPTLDLPTPATPAGLASIRTLPPFPQPRSQHSKPGPVLSAAEAATPPRSDTSHSRRKQRAPERSRQPSDGFGSLLGLLPEGGCISQPSSASPSPAPTAMPPAQGSSASHPDKQGASADEQEDAASPDRRSPKRLRFQEGPGACPCSSSGTASSKLAE